MKSIALFVVLFSAATVFAQEKPATAKAEQTMAKYQAALAKLDAEKASQAAADADRMADNQALWYVGERLSHLDKKECRSVGAHWVQPGYCTLVNGGPRAHGR